MGGGEDVGGAYERAAAAEGCGFVDPPLYEGGIWEQRSLLVDVAVNDARLHVWGAVRTVCGHRVRPRHGLPATGGRRIEQRRGAAGGGGQGAAGQALAAGC